MGILILCGLWGTEIGLNETQLESIQLALLAFIGGRAIHDAGLAIAKK